MNEFPAPVNLWQQQRMFPADSLRIQLQAIVHSSGNLITFGLHSADFYTDELDSMQCSPSLPYTGYRCGLDFYRREFEQLLVQAVHPFGAQ